METNETKANKPSFLGEGFESFPSLYFDNRLVSTFSEWTVQRLEEHVYQYSYFLAEKQMPRATETAKRILDHLLFELAYRDGVYDDTPKHEDELCEETVWAND